MDTKSGVALKTGYTKVNMNGTAQPSDVLESKTFYTTSPTTYLVGKLNYPAPDQVLSSFKRMGEPYGTIVERDGVVFENGKIKFEAGYYKEGKEIGVYDNLNAFPNQVRQGVKFIGAQGMSVGTMKTFTIDSDPAEYLNENGTIKEGFYEGDWLALSGNSLIKVGHAASENCSYAKVDYNSNYVPGKFTIFIITKTYNNYSWTADKKHPRVHCFKDIPSKCYDETGAGQILELQEFNISAVSDEPLSNGGKLKGYMGLIFGTPKKDFPYHYFTWNTTNKIESDKTSWSVEVYQIGSR